MGGKPEFVRKNFLTVKEAAAHMQISEKTMYRLCRTPGGPPVRIINTVSRNSPRIKLPTREFLIWAKGERCA